MSNARKRKDASARLGLEIQKKFQQLAMATGESEINQAAMELGEVFNSNLEFVIWVLKEYGGIEQLPLASTVKTHAHKMAKSS